MNSHFILCIDDERDILDSVVNDLAPFHDQFEIEAAESVAEAKDVIADLTQEGCKLALVLCDHIMPEELGVDFLIALSQSPDTANTRKLLLTGQAGLEDTVQAVNHASLHYFIAKPWQGEKLRSIVTDQLTSYMIATEDNLLPWASTLDTGRIMEAVNGKRLQYGSSE